MLFFTNFHFYSVIITIFIGLFKDEVKHTTTSIVHFFTRRFDVGTHLQIEGCDGNWYDVKVLSYTIHIPVIKNNGGVEVYHINADQPYAELLPFDAWRALRKRIVVDSVEIEIEKK